MTILVNEEANPPLEAEKKIQERYLKVIRQ
jgi:hypothetical protein